MLPSTAGRSPMFALACSAGAVLLFIFGFMAWSTPERIPFPHSSGSTHVEMYVKERRVPSCLGPCVAPDSSSHTNLALVATADGR